MSTTLTQPRVCNETVEVLIVIIGSVSLDRIPLRPYLGTATEEDVINRPEGDDGLYELVEGVLILKAMGYKESALAMVLVHLLRIYLDEHNIGVIAGEAGTLRLAPGLVRMPDVSFISWDRFPNRRLPEAPMPDIAPDLAVEIISAGNTREEMALKLSEYFASGTRLVWYLYPKQQVVKVYTSPTEETVVTEDGYLDGLDVLPGFRLRVRDWLDRTQNPDASP